MTPPSYDPQNVNQGCGFLLVIQNCVMNEIEHTRTLGKVHNTKILGLLIDPLKMTTADAGDVLLRLAYSANLHGPVTC